MVGGPAVGEAATTSPSLPLEVSQPAAGLVTKGRGALMFQSQVLSQAQP